MERASLQHHSKGNRIPASKIQSDFEKAARVLSHPNSTWAVNNYVDRRFLGRNNRDQFILRTGLYRVVKINVVRQV